MAAISIFKDGSGSVIVNVQAITSESCRFNSDESSGHFLWLIKLSS